MKNFILFVLCGFLSQLTSAQQPSRVLKGKVFDEAQNPLENVNISIKNTTQGTTTGSDGSFELEVSPVKTTLLVSNLGFEKQEIPIDLRKNRVTTIRIRLNATTYKLEEVTVSSNLSIIENSVANAKVRHRTIPGGTNVVSMDQLGSQRSLTLKDALKLQPGVIIQEFFGSNDQPRLNIRGSGIQSNPQFRGINLLQDGISTNLADGSYIIGVIEPRAANYIEVFRGANGLRYGATTLGGAINLVSKNGYNALPLNIAIEGGSFDYLGASISSGLVFGKNDLFTSVSYNKSDGFRAHNTSSRLNAMLNIGRKFNDKFESRLYFTYTDLEFDVTGPLTQAQMDADPKQISTGVNPPISIGPNVVRDRPRRATEIFRIANKNMYWFSENSSLIIGFHYQYGDDTFVFPMADGIRGSESNDFGINLDFNTKSKKNSLSVGLNTTIGKMHRKYFANFGGEKGLQYSFNELTANNIVFYIEDIYRIIPKLSVIASAQLSSNTRNNKDLFPTPNTRPFFDFATQSYGVFSTPDTSLDQDYFGFNPKLGLIYDMKPQQQLFLNVSRSYEPPTYDELINQSRGNPNKGAELIKSVELDEQTATTFEVGTRGTYKKINWDITFYNSWLKNEILTTTTSFGISGITRNSPDQTIHQGLELGFDVTVFNNIFSQNNDKVSFNLVYNYSDFYFKEGIYKDKQLAGIPTHYIASSLHYIHPKGFFVDLNTEWQPEGTPTDHQNTIYQKSFQLFGFRMGYTTEKWGVYVEGKNVTDEIYASSYLIRDVVIDPPPPVLTPANVTTFIPGAGINFSIGVNYRL